MARMSNHEIVDTYKVVDSDERYHVTKNDRVLVITGPRLGGAKILMYDEQFKFNYHGRGRRATATEFMPIIQQRIEKGILVKETVGR